MKNNILKITAILLIFIGSFSCNEEKVEKQPKVQTPTEYDSCGRIDINEKEFVQMCISPYIVSTDSPTPMLIIKNNTTKGLNYGRVFSIEYFNEGNWIQIQPLNIFITLEILYTDASTTSEYEMKYESINTSESLYSLVERCNNGKKGMYRIIKTEMFLVENIQPIGERFNLYAEFKIE